MPDPTLTKRLFFLGVLILLFVRPFDLQAQQIGFQFSNKHHSQTVPFEVHGQLIVIDVWLNNALPLKFIVDTGAEHTIILKKEVCDLLNVVYDAKTMHIVGVDQDTLLQALIARRIMLGIGSTQMQHDVLVLSSDFFSLDQRIGMQIHGILGADLFNGYLLEIDYVRQRLTISEPKNNKPKRGFTALPIEIQRYKPYINTFVSVNGTDSLPVKLLLDTGADLALLLTSTPKSSFPMPEKIIPSIIGVGIGGNVEGAMGRIPKLQFGAYPLYGLPTHFQTYNDTNVMLLSSNRNGIIGNAVLNKFHVIFDFSSSTLFLRPLKDLSVPIMVDRSGLQMVASGESLNRYLVAGVVPNSPAALAGIQIGDEVLRINGKGTNVLSLTQLQFMMAKEKNRTYKLTLSRNEKKFQTSFTLKDLI